MFSRKRGRAHWEEKNAETLKKQYDPSTIPPKISQWITHKFHFRSQSAIQKN